MYTDRYVRKEQHYILRFPNEREQHVERSVPLSLSTGAREGEISKQAYLYATSILFSRSAPQA